METSVHLLDQAQMSLKREGATTMRVLGTFVSEFLWTAFWIFLVLIIGFAILSFLSSRMQGNIIGTAAEWVGSHAEFQG